MEQLDTKSMSSDDEQIPLTLPDTQNADALSQLTISQCTQEQNEGTPVVWGRLCPYKSAFKTLVMTRNLYTVGRAENCDIRLSAKDVMPKWLAVMSKVHFQVIKECLNGNTKDEVVYLEDRSHNGTHVNGRLVGHGNRIVLANNDIIALVKPEFKVYIFMSTMAFDGSGLPSELSSKYAISRTLGSGVCGEVKMVFSKIGCKKFAMKTIVKKHSMANSKRHSMNDPEKIMNEVRILKALKHPCIIRTEEIVDTPSTVYIVLELMEGGELFERIRRSNGLSEKNTKFIFYQVALAVQYLHGQGITHRDLKPENILLANDNEMTLVKVSDFGLSKLVDTETMMKTFCGTPMYVAPEVLLTKGQGSYTSQVDIWSLGVILYVCLSGLVPFTANDRELSLQEQIIQGKYKFPNQKFGHLSSRVLHLIQKMLTVDPAKRYTISQVLSHSWLHDREMQRSFEILISNDECDENSLPSSVWVSNERRMDPPMGQVKRRRVE